MSDDQLTAVVMGCGEMGTLLAEAWEKNGHRVGGVVARGQSGEAKGTKQLADKLKSEDIGQFTDFKEALSETGAQVLISAALPESHFPASKYALENGVDVFSEKPIALKYQEGEQLKAAANANGTHLMIDYELRRAPQWRRYVELAKALRGPEGTDPLRLVMRLDQRTETFRWQAQKGLLAACGNPFVDCGPHYVDIMMDITDSEVVSVAGRGMSLAEGFPKDQHNWGELTLTFADGSIGIYDSIWGPGIPDEYHSQKHVTSQNGSVEMVYANFDERPLSYDVGGHINVEHIRVRSAELDADGKYAIEDDIVDVTDPQQNANLFTDQLKHLVGMRTGDVSREEENRLLDRDILLTKIVTLGYESSLQGGVPMLLND